MIPTATIDEILDRVDIVEVISSYIPLKRAGRNFKALCPFHHEKTSSFMVSADKQIYHCFGCGAGGNALNFVMQYERMDFLEAVEFLSQKVGVEITRAAFASSKDNSGIKGALAKVNELAGAFYHKNLLVSPEAEKARVYLKQRSVTIDMAKKMRLGFALDKWDALHEYLKSKNLNPSLAIQLGLVIAKDKGGFYDRFRNRIIFPIFDSRGGVIGFGGRVLPVLGGAEGNVNLPKYINSPETPLYIKGENLYGLNFSKEAIREKDLCLVVEGYMDFFIPYTCGIDNIVASLGTALTVKQIRLIKRYTHNVVMVYDSDLAGESATVRSLDLFIEEGMNVKVIPLEKGSDPDLFVRKFGKDAFIEKIKKAQSLFDYKINFLKKHYGTEDIYEKAKIIEEMLITVNRFTNAVVKSEYLRRLSEELKVSEFAIMKEAASLKAKEKNMRPDEPKNRINNFQARPILAFEKLLVKLILQEEELAHRIKDAVSPSDFQDKALSRIMDAVFQMAELGRSVNAAKLLQHFSEDHEAASLVCELSTSELVLTDREKVINECISRLRKEALKSSKEKICENIKSAQAAGNQDRLNNLLLEFNALIKGEVS